MKSRAKTMAVALAVGACFASGAASAFNSGSTGADGAFNPTVNTTVQIPPSGIFNFTSVNIPTGVTVTFTKNVTNTPVVILASGDVAIAGTLNVSGASASGTGAAGTGATGDDGNPGAGGPGGHDGGRGGRAGSVGADVTFGGYGLGPGAGAYGWTCNTNFPGGGAGGGFGSAGTTNCNGAAIGGPAYGSSALLPLIGGSGGGGGAGGTAFLGSGGGGGGGAILIAASGTVSVTGSLLANGGTGGQAAGGGSGGGGGGGSGGGIRIIATTITGNGTISAAGGAGGTGVNAVNGATGGGTGRIRLEAETYTRTAASNPGHTFAQPGQVFVAGTPTLTISSVAGVNAPAAPTGNADITLAATTANPVTVVFTTTGVPVGNTVQLTVTPAYHQRTVVVSPALAGSTASATASVQVTLPVGPSVLSAQTTYTVVASLGDGLSRFANNERVERITLIATLGGKSRMKLITVSGREYDAPEEAVQIAALGG